MSDLLSIGTLVSLRANPIRSGPIISELSAVSGERRFQVYHGVNDIREYLASQLVSIASSTQSQPESLVDPTALVDAEIFRARLTAARLSNPETDSLYALYAARVKFVPFQYKPLLKLLRSDQMRLLIADEVGVGKTIEAGLVLKELQVRQRLDRVLIVCPKALVRKWQMEIRRFDEEFEILTSESLRNCLRESHHDGEWPINHGRCIVALETVRQEEILSGAPGKHRRYGFRELNPAPRFDLFIVDEAHHCRNSKSLSYQAVRFLADQSEAAIFLSATPVHVGSRNLFVLLNLLRPDQFPDQSVFDDMVAPNRWITEAMRLARSRKNGWELEAGEALSAAANTAWGRTALSADLRFTAWASSLGNGVSLSDRERVRCIRDLEEVHTLAHVMNRTRRRDVGRFTIREPHTLSVEFTAPQRRFYDDLLQFRRDVFSLKHDPRIVRLITDTLERQASSCLPALIPLLDRMLGSGEYDPSLTSDAMDEDDADEIDEPFRLPPHLIVAANDLRRQMAEMPLDDPKYDRLAELALESMRTENRGKLLIFSFFLHTLAYLEDGLKQSGFRVATITGRLDEDERESLRDRFRLPRTDTNALDILLSSEVGCEGLDYEFCDRMVNYDIPWNPMRIEQRIGRIDRYGQEAEKVLIFNFVTPGTVEERIFFRCFERLGIFRDTVGDLEEVLGEMVNDLKRLSLDPGLTTEQANEHARQTADNVMRLHEENVQLNDETAGLLGIENGFLQEVDALQSEGRFVAPNDVRSMIKAMIEVDQLGGRLDPDPSIPMIDRVRLPTAAKSWLNQKVSELDLIDRSTTELQRWLDSNDPELSATFDQETAVKFRSLPFITPVHALTKIATAFWANKSDRLITRLTTNCPDIPPGAYLFTCHMWETYAAAIGVQMVTSAINLEKGQIELDFGRAFGRILANSETNSQTLGAPMNSIDSALAVIDEHVHALRRQELERLRSDNDILIARKLASIDAFHGNRLARVDREIVMSTDQRIERMRISERNRIENEHARARRSIEARRDADITSQRIAIGVIEVQNA